MDILKELGILNSEGQTQSSLSENYIAKGAIDENQDVYIGIFKVGSDKGRVVKVSKKLEPFLPTLCCAFELLEFTKVVNLYAKEITKASKELNLPNELSEPWEKIGGLAETLVAHANMATFVRINTKDMQNEQV